MKSQNIYDNDVFFDGYKKLRDNPYSANAVEEKPALFSLAPDLSGKAVLDLGCGYGENCAEFKERARRPCSGWTSPKRCWRSRERSILTSSLSART